MRILVVGAGAVGGYFGARLAQAGRDVTFLVRPKRAERMAREGLTIVTKQETVTLDRPHVVTAGTIDGPYDVIFLSVKAMGLEQAMADFAPAVGDQTMILPVLNGMRHMDLLTKRFGSRAVIGGVAIIATELDKDDRIVKLADFEIMRYGELTGEPSPRIAALDALFQGIGTDAAATTGIVQAMWEKWVQLSSLGTFTCLLGGPVGAIVAVPGGESLAKAIIAECAAVATACGHPPSEAFLTRQTAALTMKGAPTTSSMFRDMRKGAPVEAETILGDLVALAHEHGVAAPLVEAAYVALCVYQSGLAKA